MQLTLRWFSSSTDPELPNSRAFTRPFFCAQILISFWLASPLALAIESAATSGKKNPTQQIADLPAAVAKAEKRLEAADPSGAVDAFADVLDDAFSAATADDHKLLPDAELALLRLPALVDEVGASDRLRLALQRWASVTDDAPFASAARQVIFRARLELGFLEQPRPEGGISQTAQELWNSLGFLTAWRLVGPFDNERGGGFSQAFAPEKDIASLHKLATQPPATAVSYDGKKGKVHWRSLPTKILAGEVELAELFRPNEEVLAYAVTFVRSEADRTASIRLGSDDGFRLWVNGSLVASRDVHRDFAHDQDAFEVRLRSGWNSVLLKSAQSTGDWTFAARLTGADGGSLEGVHEGWPAPESEAPRFAPENGDAAPQSHAVTTSPSEVRLRAGLETGGSSLADARSHYLLGALLREKGAHDRGEHPDTEALERAIELDSAPAIYHHELAKSLERQTVIAAERDDNAWRAVLLQAVDRGSAAAALELSDYYLRTFVNVGQSREFLDAAQQLGAAKEGLLRRHHALEVAQSFPAAATRFFGQLATVESPSIQSRSEWAAHLLDEGQPEAAIKTLTDFLRRHPRSFSARIDLAGMLLALDRVDEAQKTLEQGAVFWPFETLWQLELAELHEGQDSLGDAVRFVERALQIRPSDETLWEQLGGLLLRRGERESALGAFEKALALQPNLPRLREYLNFLRAKPADFENRVRIDLDEIVQAAWQEGGEAEVDSEGDPARILLDLKAIQVNPDGTTKTFVQQAIQVLNDRGLRQYDRFTTHYSDGEQLLEFKHARVHRRDGTVAQAKLNRFGADPMTDGEVASYRRASVDIPPLSKGDVIEVEFVREDIRQSFFGDYFGHRETFQGTVSTARKKFILEVPAGREFYFHAPRLEVKPTEEEGPGGTRIYTWNVTQIPKLEPEPAMTPLREAAPALEVSTFKDWNAFTTWYWNLIRKQYEGSDEISRTVSDLTKNATNDLDKIRAVYNFVVEDVRYNAWEFGVHGFKPYNAATIFARRFGDCKDKATLISVMLREVGIESHPVLVRAESRRGAEDLTLPLINHFNHCITYVPSGADRPALFLDGTAQNHALEQLPSMDRGARVLVVRPEGKGLLAETAWNKASDFAIVEERRTTIHPDFSATVETRVKCDGDYAVYVRKAFEIPAQRTRNLERIYARRFAGATVRDEEFSDLENIDEPVTFAVKLKIPNYVSEAPEGLVIRPPEDFFQSSGSLTNLATLDERKYDLLLGNPRRAQVKVTYILPEGYRLKSLPPKRAIATDFGSLGVSFHQASPYKLEAEYQFEITAPRIRIAEYEAFREFTASLERLKEEKIILERS